MHGKQGWKRVALSLLLTATMLLQCAAPIGGMVLAAETEQSQPVVQAAQPSEAPKSEPTAAPTAEPTEAPKAEPTTEPIEAPQGESTVEPTAEPIETPESEPDDKPAATDEPMATPDAHPKDKTEVGSDSDQDAPREPRALDTLDKVELLDANGGKIEEGASLPKPGDGAKVRLRFDGVKDLAAGDYTVVELPGALRFAKDDEGTLKGGVGEWTLDASERKVKWTFNEKTDGKCSGEIVLEAELAYDGEGDVKLVFEVKSVARSLVLTFAPYVDAAAREARETADEVEEGGDADEDGDVEENGDAEGNDDTNEENGDANEVNGDADDENGYNAPKVKISKVTVTGGPELPGATLKLYDVETGEMIRQWVSGTTPTEFEISGGEGKQYRLVEEISPDGYALAEEIVFTMGEQGSVTPLEMLDKPTHVTISKVGITGGPELPGATLKLLDAEGKLIETWVSGDKPHEIVARLIAGKTYTLVEESAPDGYTVAESITFTVSRDGRVDKVTMLDKPTDVSISKRRITGSAELKGATLKLVDAEGRMIERWVSGNRPHRIVAKLLAGETYTLIEESAPKGYKIAKPITFTVKMNGEPQRIIMRDALIDPETGDPNEPGTPGYGDPNEPGTPGYGEPGEPGTPGYGVLPETGDNTNAALWLGVLGASLLLLATAVALLMRKRRKTGTGANK